MGNKYTHRGDIGDLLAALSALYQIGNCDLYLQQHSCTGNRMNPERVNSLKPLLEFQPYINSVEWTNKLEGNYLDLGVRSNYKNKLNLADMQCESLKLPHLNRDQPWISVPEIKRVAKVIFARSSRYWSWTFPWKKVWDLYHLDAVFCGTPQEHADFVQGVGPVAYYHTKDYLELAKVIAGSQLICVNQTSIFWLAEALKMPICLEVYTHTQNCHVNRSGLLYCTNEHMPFPEDVTQNWMRVIGFDIGNYILEIEKLPGEMALVGCNSDKIKVICPNKKLHVFNDNNIPKENNVYSFVQICANSSGYIRTILSYFVSRMVKGGIIIIDNYDQLKDIELLKNFENINNKAVLRC